MSISRIRFIASSWNLETGWKDFGVRISLYRDADAWSLIPQITLGSKTHSVRITNMTNG